MKRKSRRKDEGDGWKRGKLGAVTFVSEGHKKVRSNSETEPISKRPKLKVLIRNEGQGETEQ